MADDLTGFLAPEDPEQAEAAEEELEDPSTVYWARREADQLIAELDRKERAYFESVDRRGFGTAWLGAFAQYYGLSPDSLGTWETQSIGFDGEQGELLRFRINEFRSFVKQSLTMALGNRPAFQCLASNTDYGTLAQIETADSAVNWIYTQEFGERKERRTAEKGVLFGLGWTWVVWDPEGGEEVEVPLELPPELGGGPSPETEFKRTGELVIKSKNPWEVFHEPLTEEFDDHLWRCVRDRRSKWEVAARVTDREARNRILQMSCRDELAIESQFGFDRADLNPDDVLVKHFYHSKCRAFPEGRYLAYVGREVIYDGPLPYSVIPLIDLIPAEYIGTAFGYADSWDLIPLNQMLDAIVSDIATNVHNFGRGLVAVEDSSDYNEDTIASGTRVLSIPPGGNPPVAVQLAEISEAPKWLLSYLDSRFQSVSGLNAVSRGDPSKTTSGTMAALFHSIALEFSSALQAAIDSHRTRVANLILAIVKEYMWHPMLLQIAGADERPYLSEFTRDQLMGVPEVMLVTANPMARSQAGRLQIAEMLLKIPGAIQTPQQVVEILASGQIKPLTKGPRTEMLTVAWENEALAKGPPVTVKQDPLTGEVYECVESVPALATDNPQKHVNEHLAGIASPQARQNAAIMRAHLAHIAEHIRHWKAMDPALAALRGFPPPPMIPGMPGIMPTGQPANDNGQPNLDLPEPKERDSTGVPLPEPAESPIGPQNAVA